MYALFNNVDKILVGRALGSDLLGLYGQAFGLMQKPITVLMTPLTGIMLPGLSRAADDPDQYRRVLLVFFRFLGLVMFPVGVGLAIVAPEAFRVLGGAEFADAGPILAVLSLSILVQGFFIALSSVLAAAGQGRRLSICAAVNAAVMCGSYFVGLEVGQRVGNPVLGVAWAYTLTLVVLVFPVYLGYVLRTVRIGYRDWLAQLKVALPAAVVMGAVVLGCRWLLKDHFHWSDRPLLAVEVAVGVLAYVLLAWPDIRWFLDQGLKGPALPQAGEGK
jgi:O-antigen/teichoic acid export membrane protein